MEKVRFINMSQYLISVKSRYKMLTEFAISVIGIIVIFFVAELIYARTRFRKLIDLVPGPETIPVLGNTKQLMCSPEQLFLNIRHLSKEYYPIYRLWSGPMGCVNIVSPEDVEIILSSTKHIEKSRVYDLLHSWLNTGLLTSGGAKWQTRRKILTPAFHFNILQQFIMVFAEQSQCLISELKSECYKPYTNVVPYITRFTLNAICETAMGVNSDAKQNDQDNYKQAIYKMGDLLVHRLVRPWWYLDITYNNFSKEGILYNKLVKILHNFSNGIIQERKKTFSEQSERIRKVMFDENEYDVGSYKKRLAMLDLLLYAKASGANIDDEGIREEVDTFTFEGHDTTSMGICFALFCLANNPDIQENVYREIKEIFGDSDRMPNHQDLNNMRYLERCVKEALRIYPSVPFISRQLKEDCVLSDYTVPNGCLVHIHIFDIHRNPKIFPNPEVYDPDRFLPEAVQGRHPYSYIPFSAGPRNCIGQRFALLEEKTVISTILRHYRLEAVDTPETVRFVCDIVLRSANGIRIKFHSRK